MSISTADLPDGLAPARDARAELAALRAQAERLMAGRAPALAGAVADGSRRLRELVEENAGAAAGAMRGYPLAALALAAGAGYLLGRLASGRRGAR